MVSEQLILYTSLAKLHYTKMTITSHDVQAFIYFSQNSQQMLIMDTRQLTEFSVSNLCPDHLASWSVTPSIVC